MLVLVVKLSVPVVKNMVMPERGQQLMNTSFDRWVDVFFYMYFGGVRLGLFVFYLFCICSR